MADCRMCGCTHYQEEHACPEARTGETIAGKYELGEIIGIGGMAAVYAARNTTLERDVALKILHERFASDEELGARFQREARETAAVGHPAFVAVHEGGTSEDGCAYIEMDRLAGQDLFSVRESGGALPVDLVVAISISVLDALAALHGRRVVHRDVTSANIFLSVDRDGGEQVRILDLGFAKADDQLDLTHPDELLGSPFYISPEQYVDPTCVDARADLFSLGIVMFELLTDTWPYTYDSKHDLLHKVLHGELERHPRTRRSEIPAWLDAIVARALELHRAKRFESAADMRDALIRGEPPPPVAKAEKTGFLRRWFGRS